MPLSRKHGTQGEVPNMADYSGACRGKVQHSSRKLAEGAKRVLLRDKPATRTDLLRSYKCRVCRKWHIGNVRPIW